MRILGMYFKETIQNGDVPFSQRRRWHHQEKRERDIGRIKQQTVAVYCNEGLGLYAWTESAKRASNGGNELGSRLEPRWGLAGSEAKGEGGWGAHSRQEGEAWRQAERGTSMLQQWIAKGPAQENPRANTREQWEIKWYGQVQPVKKCF